MTVLDLYACMQAPADKKTIGTPLKYNAKVMLLSGVASGALRRSGNHAITKQIKFLIAKSQKSGIAALVSDSIRMTKYRYPNFAHTWNFALDSMHPTHVLGIWFQLSCTETGHFVWNCWPSFAEHMPDKCWAGRHMERRSGWRK
jgi:hypothetical protein